MKKSLNTLETQKTIKVMYAYYKHLDSNGTIEKLFCYDPISKKSNWFMASSISRKIYKGEWFVYAGEYKKEEHAFINVCVVIPMITDNTFHLTSVTDDEKENNLENLPEG